MDVLERALGVTIPKSILRVVHGIPFQIDKIGKSSSQVAIFEEYTLKVSSLSFDIENEVRISKVLQNVIPIPELLAYEVVSGKVFLLKRKLQGKMLCDDYYMNRPNLLFALAAKAISLLWSVDIHDLDLQDSFATVLDFGKKANRQGLLDILKSDLNATKGFRDFNEILDYLICHKPEGKNVLTHGDLCLTNILCDEDKLVGFIDLGLMGKSHPYHDLAILYRSIQYNFAGVYGKAYPGFEKNRLFDLLHIKKDESLIRYYLLLDEVLG